MAKKPNPKKSHLENHSQVKLNFYSDLHNLYHRNHAEINKQLITLAAIGFAYNLSLFQGNSLSWMTLSWAGTNLGLGFTIFWCFFIFKTTADIQALTIGLLNRENDLDRENYGEFKAKRENKIKWFNRFKAIAFFSFMLSITNMVVFIFLFNPKT